MQAQYAFRNLSNDGLYFIETGVKIAASISDSVIFLYLGIQIWGEQSFDWWFIIMAILICFFVRFIGVFLVSLITKDGGGDNDWRSRVVMSYAGIRGAVSFALASLHRDQIKELTQSVRFREHHLHLTGNSITMFVSTTQILIFTTTLIQGTTIR